jgi:hypothetical protein
LATYVNPTYLDCTGGASYGPLYYSFQDCGRPLSCVCPFPEPFTPEWDALFSCDNVFAVYGSCCGVSPSGDWGKVTFHEDFGCERDPFSVSGLDTPTDGCLWIDGFIGIDHDIGHDGEFLVSPDLVLNWGPSAGTPWGTNPAVIWAKCGRLGGGSLLDPAHPDCDCNATPSHCGADCSWLYPGTGMFCQSFCPICATFTHPTFDPANGLCRGGTYDGHCPPGTHPDPACGVCVSDTPPRKCWFWRDCKWNPPSACEFPFLFDVGTCSCFCPPLACPPGSFPDPATCTCRTCPEGQCWCVTERRCVLCDDPPCKEARQCYYDPVVCDWNCLPEPPGSLGCAFGEHYDLDTCSCVPDCPEGQCWCDGTASCMACSPPDCAAELKCVWDRAACDWVCQDPPCVAPETWTGPPLCTCDGGEKGPWNFHTILAHYHAASDDKGIRYQRSETSIPPFVADVQVTTDPAHTQPRMVRDWRRRWLLLYTDNSSGTPKVVEIVSHDDGDTWSHPRTVFMSAKHPMPAGPLPYAGCVLYAAYSAGNILIERQYPGDPSPSASFTAKDETGADLTVDDASFGLSPAPDGAKRWVLHVLIGGTRRHLLSTDDGESFEVVS